MYLSTDGAGYVPAEWLGQVPRVIIAMDNDQGGEEMTTKLTSELPTAQRVRPHSKDWSEDVRVEVKIVMQRISQKL